MKERSTNHFKQLASLVLVLLLFGAMAMTAYATEAEPACYGYGDVNGDNGVDGRDAIYTLYHVMFAESYPVNQSCDFNRDGSLDSSDAIQVLYGCLGMVPEFTLGETVHEYYAPQWSWGEEGSVKVTFQCACGSTTVLTLQDGVTVDKAAAERTSCTDPVAVTYTAAVTFDGVEYTNVHTEIQPAVEHIMSDTRNCLEGSHCTVCEYTLSALGHDWVLDESQSTAATCQVPGTQVYVCSREGCTETRTVVLAGLAAHDFQYVQDTPLEDGCAYVKEYCCSNCDETMRSAPFYKHTYTAVLTREATCVAEGEKTLTCACGDTKTEPVPVNDSHLWGEGVTGEDGITTFTCVCGATKTAMLVEGNQATVEKDALVSSEIQLDNAYVKLDAETLNDLGETIQIDVQITTADNIGLDSSYAQQIGSNPVYDFSLYSDFDLVSAFAGQATITLPYTLQEGDDVDCIDVWYINDSGEVEIVQGEYANGFVTFATDHFSYYTVTRLTPAQRCEKYGHAMGTDHQDATCTSNGHHVVVCRRCGWEEQNEILERLPHSYDETRVEPTCLEDGSFEKVCSACLQKVSGTLPALGHSWSLNAEQSCAPSCTAAGKDVYVCGNTGCTETYAEETPSLGHHYEMIGQVNADCTTSGYEGYKCTLCGDEYRSNEVVPEGHDYDAANAVWQWEDDYSAATVKLVCSRNAEHTQTLKAVITKTVDAPNCSAGGEITYTAVAAFNMKEYTDVKTVQMDKVGHQAGDAWLNNAGIHYHECTFCGEMMDTAAHVLDETTVITPATCNRDGSGKAACTICGYEKDMVLTATGEHNFVNGVCSVCGFRKDVCSHNAKYSQAIDVSAYDLCDGFRAWWNFCDCGEQKYLSYDIRCSFGEESEIEGTLPNGETGTIYTNSCTNCGLVLEQASYSDVGEEACEFRDIFWVRMSLNGEVILESINPSSEIYSHNTNIPVETIELSDSGLCGLKLVKYRCHCGEHIAIRAEEDLCQWEYMGNESGASTFRCRVCGATWTQKWTYATDKATCKSTETGTFAYYMGDTEIYSYTTVNEMDAHSYEVTDYRLDGDTCEDGVYIEQTCSVCNAVHSYYSYWHESVIHTETDIRDEGLCGEEFVQSACLCGETKYFELMSYDGDYCAWESVSHDASTNTDTQRCQKCGLTKTSRRTTGEKNESCQAMVETVYTYTKADGTLLAEGSSTWSTTNHDMLVTRELSGTSCEDGVKITEVCRDCGTTSSWSTTYHSTQWMESYDLAEYGMCGGTLDLYSCACGYQSHESWSDALCDWIWVSGDAYSDVCRCSICGVTRKITYAEPEAVDTCHYQRDVSITFTKSNKTLLKVGFVETFEEHRYTHTFQLDGTTCLDGYQVTEVCADCGETHTWHHNDDAYHGTWTVSREMLLEDTLCSDLELVTYQCACGMYQSQQLNWLEDSCEFYGGEYVEAEDGWRYTCANCGIQQLEKVQHVKSDVPCSEKYQRTYIFYRNNTELYRVETTSIQENHGWIYSYELVGDTCSEGYYYTRTCADCGSREKSGLMYGNCSSRSVDREVLLDHADICHPITLVTYNCACGNSLSTNLEGGCNWEYVRYDEAADSDIYQCRDCGLCRTGSSKYVHQSGTCDATEEIHYVYSLNGEQLLDLNTVLPYKAHETVATFEMFGADCTDGYRVTHTCVYCGRTSEGGASYEHNTYQTAFYALDTYGLCGGYLYRNSCPCGNETSWHFGSNDCNWYYTGKTVDGMSESYCAQCDTYRYTSETGERNPDTCRWEGTFVVRLVRNGETVLDLREAVCHDEHHHVVQSFEFENPSLGCDGSTLITLVCQDCGNVSTNHSYGHSSYTVEYVDLDQEYPDSCGGYISYDKCPCGEYSNVYYNFSCNSTQTKSWSEEGADGYTHDFYQESCPTCGLMRLRESYTIRDTENCEKTVFNTYTFRLNGALIGTYTTDSIYTAHSYGEASAQLAPGSASCEDGVLVSYTCTVCGNESQDRYYNHSLYAAEHIDLTPYGSVCGGELVRYACACGEYQKYDFAEGSPCDIDKKSIANFVPGSIDTAQHTTQGWVSTYSDSWIMTCAVTDPQCSLKIRMSEYWLEEDCMATEYQLWQLGYDEATGTFQQELKVATGETHAYHPYVSANSTDTLADGTTVYIDTDLCPNCASSYIRKDYYLNGAQTKTEYIATNSKNNGERKRWYTLHEYGEEHSGYRYITLERTEYTYADDSTYWYQHAHTYDFAAGCVSTTTYTSSNGDYSVYTNESHITDWTRETLCDSTCTQFGEYIGRWTCVICGKVTSEYTYYTDPVAHSWSYDSTRELYTCSICGLENVNGASGAIVLEDMTAKHGNGADYVVGYWNRDSVEARKYVSVVLFDADSEEVVLTDIPFSELTRGNDGITAISFSQAQAQAAADAAMAQRGYTGSYAIRFTFVPVGSEDTLDYAITFDSQNV